MPQRRADDERATDKLWPAETFSERRDGAAGGEYRDQVEDQTCVRDGEIADRAVEGEKWDRAAEQPGCDRSEQVRGIRAGGSRLRAGVGDQDDRSGEECGCD